MKILLAPLAILLAAGASLCGCASGPTPQQRAAVPSVPKTAQTSAVEPDGRLIVYSALDTSPEFYPATPYHRAYSDYQILSVDGRLLKKVRNESADIFGEPATVKLPPGKYQIVAHSIGRGLVTVPVVVAAGKTTTVRLEAGLPPTNDTADSGAAQPAKP